MKKFIGLRFNKNYLKKSGRSQLYLLVGLSGGELASLTNQFIKIDLVKEWGSTRDFITISLNVESHDFIGRGFFLWTGDLIPEKC